MLAANLPPRDRPPQLAHPGEAVNGARGDAEAHNHLNLTFAPIPHPPQATTVPGDREPFGHCRSPTEGHAWHGRHARAKLLADQKAEAGS
jgi:hypothetical protein